ncbi:MAG: DUF975 family protein [Oscillospiraceae bacterium]|nr:DUF975 family protein [Oscillospiraceae bacterium]
MFSRSEAKLRAQAAQQNARPSPALVTLIYLLLTVLVSYIVMLIFSSVSAVSILSYAMFDYGTSYYNSPDMLNPAAMIGPLAALFIIMIIVALYMSIMQYGYYSYAIRLARKEQPGYSNLFDGFYKFGKVIAATILQSIFIFLWTLLGMIPFFVFYILALVLSSPFLVVLAVLGYIWGVIFACIILYRYRLTLFFLIDNPDMGPLQAITASKHAMKGKKWTLFVLDLSFLGWHILCAFTLYILSLWIEPYYTATLANFYNHTVHGTYCID